MNIAKLVKNNTKSPVFSKDAWHIYIEKAVDNKKDIYALGGSTCYGYYVTNTKTGEWVACKR